MKKMTVNEFKNTLQEAGMNFECWGWEGILNLIAMANSYQKKDLEAIEGMGLIAEEAGKRSDTITNILNERGYYNA